MEDGHILTAFSIAMTDKAERWWEYAEKALPHPQTWQAAKETFLRKYGNILKRDECTEKLMDLYQGSMSIADFFTEIEELNLYAQLDPESVPRFLKRRLNLDLRHALEISHSIKPITRKKKKGNWQPHSDPNTQTSWTLHKTGRKTSNAAG